MLELDKLQISTSYGHNNTSIVCENVQHDRCAKGVFTNNNIYNSS